MKRGIQILGIMGLGGLMIWLSGWRFEAGQIEQDHYFEYAAAIKQGSLNLMAKNDWRLLPGLAWLLMVPGGIWVVRLSWVACAMLLLVLTRSGKSVLVLLFPPVMLAAGTIVSTEIITVFWLLLALWSITHRQFWLAAVALGMGTWFRLICLIAALAVFVWLITKRQFKDLLVFGYVYGLFVTALLLWNLFVFGDVLVQIKGYMGYARPVMGIWQLILDVPRAISWGWWRQVVSGLVYLALLIGWIGWVIRKQQHHGLIWWMALLMTGFVFTIGPTPFLEEFPRFLVPVWPLLWLLTYKKVKGWWLWLLPLISVVVVLV